MMPGVRIPVIDSVKLETRSKGLERCWHVRYQFCGLAAEIAVHGVTEDEAFSRAVDELRLRGLKVI
jgi:hypothetical protein